MFFILAVFDLPITVDGGSGRVANICDGTCSGDFERSLRIHFEKLSARSGLTGSFARSDSGSTSESEAADRTVTVVACFYSDDIRFGGYV